MMLRSIAQRQVINYGLTHQPGGGVKIAPVRVIVRIANAMDEGMVREGFQKADSVRRVEIDALIDIGLVECVIPAALADELGLVRPFTQTVQHADGREEEVDVTEPVLLEIMNRKVYEECLVLGDEVLIGQTALESTDLFVDCRSGKLVPNPAHPNRPVINIR